MNLQVIRCETAGCRRLATHVYGPECCADNLMYLCDPHADGIKNWIALHQNEPVKCPTHGAIGKAKAAIYVGKM